MDIEIKKGGQGTMDIPRKSKAGKKRLRTAVISAATLGLLTLATIALARMKPAALGVERSTLWIGSVERGPMTREVRGAGRLVPRAVRVIASPNQGRVERILVQPGAQVSPGTLLVELANPELEQAAVDADYQVRAAEADLNNIRVKLESERLTQQATTASARAEFQQAEIQTDTDETLAKDGLVPAMTLRLSRVRVEALKSRYEIEGSRLQISSKSAEAQLSSQQARVEQLRALAVLRRAQVGTLSIRAAEGGVLQEIQAEVGQQVTPGAVIARVVEPQQLKAELQIPETQAKDIQLGQAASIDTRNGVVAGRVERIDPAVQQGTVKVDVELTGPLPAGARPDLSVDGSVELERLRDVVYCNRPALAGADGRISLFKLGEDGKSAVRVPVRLGRSSVNQVEILEGLHEGEEVILSDTSAFDAAERIRIN